MTYLGSVSSLLWLTFLHWLLLFPITIPVIAVSLWCLLKRAAHGRPSLPLTVFIPSALTMATVAWAAAFAQAPDAQWEGWKWPGLFGVFAVLIGSALAVKLWRAHRDRRVAGLSLLQLWILLVTAWVAGAAVSPGSGLGAL